MKRLICLLLCCFSLLCWGKTVRPLVWVLDAGHGGKDVGTESKRHQEKDITLAITKEVAALLRKHKPGIKIILTREKDVYVSLDKRCQAANRAGADLFLSIHVNAVEWKPLLSGTETFFANTRFIKDAVLQSAQSRNIERSQLLAWLLQKNYRTAGRETNRGAKPERLYVLSHTLMPAALTEVGFLSNSADEKYMTSSRGQKEIARCIYNALAEYYETTQAKTHRKTLATLQSTNGRRSGLKTKLLTVGKDFKEDAADVLQPAPELAEAESPIPTEEPADTTCATAPAPAEPVAATEDLAAATAAEPSDTVSSEDMNPVEPTSRIPVYSIQIVAVSSELRSDDERLQGLFPVTFVKSGNMFKGLYGGTTDYNQARKTLAAIREKFPDAFIVAYLGEEPISTARALELTR